MQPPTNSKIVHPAQPEARQRVHIKFKIDEEIASTQPAAKVAPKKKMSKIKEFFYFLLTAKLIFALIFFGLNYSAYSKQIGFWVGNLSASVVEAGVDSYAATDTDGGTAKLMRDAKQPAAETISGIPHLNLQATPPDNRLIVPRLNINAPIQETPGVNITDPWTQIEESVQEALRNGVVRLPNTALPGETGNAFITGHSSYYPWDEGRYKDIFALLPQIEIGDEIIVFYDQKKYVYIVSDIDEVKPDDVFVMGKTKDTRLTLMTCVPIGTTLKRLIVTAHLASEVK